MARRRRHEGMTFNFDGLTDAVTNLTGTLILLVVLMFAVTQARTRPARPAPARSPTAEMRQGEPIRPLLDRIEGLKLEIQRVDHQIRMLEGDLPRLEQQVEDLREAAEATRQREPRQERRRVKV